jgi:amino acid transporter
MTSDNQSEHREPTTQTEELESTLWGRARRMLVGRPRDLGDRSLFHRLSLIPFLAWVGLGADGLSSSSYGPEEAFKTLGHHTYLAVGLALAMAATVIIISAAYTRIIEQFPHGGGGYVVATKLLGERVGVVSGCALLVDYVLTITTSIAAAGNTLFSFLPASWQSAKLGVEVVLILGLTTLNLRGARESVIALTPIFVLFLITHVVAIGASLIIHIPDFPAVTSNIVHDYHTGLNSLGAGAMLLLFLHAYSLGGSAYTGIEAVSNGLQMMREPRVETAKRTMMYMAVSLAATAAGLLVAYLLLGVSPVPDKTLNAVLFDKLTQGMPGGTVFVILALVTEGALLVVAAQAGFLDGPRVLANMAIDSWVPRRFGALSDRLTTQNGILLMGVASMAALLYTHGQVEHLVVMYSINVFVTFSLSMLGMLTYWLFHAKREHVHWKRRTSLFAIGFLLCATILGITVHEKFLEGGWLTLVATGLLVLVCFLIHAHYQTVSKYLAKLDEVLSEIPAEDTSIERELQPHQPTAAVLVSTYGGLGIHTVLSIFRAFPGHFKNFVFLSVAVLDSGRFKGEDEVAALQHKVEADMQKYVDLARRLGFPATARMVTGIEVVAEAERLCLETAKEFPRITYFSGQVIFQREQWYQRLLHNQTAFAVQKRLQWSGMTMVILPVRVR